MNTLICTCLILCVGLAYVSALPADMPAAVTKEEALPAAVAPVAADETLEGQESRNYYGHGHGHGHGHGYGHGYGGYHGGHHGGHHGGGWYGRGGHHGGWHNHGSYHGWGGYGYGR